MPACDVYLSVFMYVIEAGGQNVEPYYVRVGLEVTHGAVVETILAGACAVIRASQ
jgi:hypothetical protein